jgi:acyl-CoA reductase-like NAD-dependent aldehyde dehydrogenase
MASTFEYAPAPESRAVLDLQASYGLFIDGQFVDTLDGRSFKTISPASEEVLAEVTEAGPADVAAAVQAARRAYETTWSKLPARERGKYLYRIARILQERARELAVLESLDNGKPIRESRDVDIPARRGALLLLRRLGRQARPRGLGPDPRPARRRRAGHPVELPAADAGLEGRAGAGVRATPSCSSPAETTPLTALLFAEICQQADLPPGVVNILTGAGETGRTVVEHPDIDKIAFTGSTEVGKAIARAVAGTGKKVTWSSAARQPTSSSTTRRSTRRSRASSTASSSTRATSAARDHACWSRSRCSTSCWAR